LWSRNAELAAALERSPELLARAWELDWSAAVARLTHATNLYVIGRGPGLAIAQEAALKFKETCGLHAEAVSAAELRHGPIALVRPGFPLLVFAQNDASRAGVAELSGELAAQGADVLLAGAQAPRSSTMPRPSRRSAPSAAPTAASAPPDSFRPSSAPTSTSWRAPSPRCAAPSRPACRACSGFTSRARSST